MELAPYFEIIYLFMCSFVLMKVVTRYEQFVTEDSLFDSDYSTSKYPFILFFVIFFVGFRPVHNVFADMVGYNFSYLQKMDSEWQLILTDSESPVFDNLFNISASLGIPATFFFLSVALVYFLCMFLACKKIFPTHYELAFLVCLTAFSTFSYGTNGIRAGAAGSIFLLALAYKDKLWLTILLSLISWGFHHSMSIVLLAYITVRYCKKTEWFFYVWLIALLMSALHISSLQVLFAEYTNKKGASYLLPQGDGAFLTGFRPDFIFYSAVPVIIGFWFVYKKKIVNEEYTLWLRMYLLTNSLWMFCMYASFSNRIAYLSWFLYPIVLIYPYIAFYWDEQQLFYAKKVAIYHMLFTLFMCIVYYQFIKS